MVETVTSSSAAFAATAIASRMPCRKASLRYWELPAFSWGLSYHEGLRTPFDARFPSSPSLRKDRYDYQHCCAQTSANHRIFKAPLVMSGVFPRNCILPSSPVQSEAASDLAVRWQNQAGTKHLYSCLTPTRGTHITINMQKRRDKSATVEGMRQAAKHKQLRFFWAYATPATGEQFKSCFGGMAYPRSNTESRM